GPLTENLAGATRRRHRAVSETSESHERAREAAVQRTRGKWSYAGCLDAAIERLVIKGEAFVMRAVARLMDVQQRHDQAGPLVVGAHGACRLNVLGRSFRLAVNHHEP